MNSVGHEPATANKPGGLASRTLVSRALFVGALLALVLGAALGQILITWLNATLL